jgi:hypothetical protein
MFMSKYIRWSLFVVNRGYDLNLFLVRLNYAKAKRIRRVKWREEGGSFKA